MPTRRGSIRIFRLFGIDVYLHYSWLLIAFIRIEFIHYHHYNSYSGIGVNIFRCLRSCSCTNSGTRWLADRWAAGRINRTMAARRRGLRVATPTSGCNALEHRSRSVGQCGAPARFFCGLVLHLSLGWPDSHPAVHLYIRTLLTMILGYWFLTCYRLSAGWWTGLALIALVSYSGARIV